MGQCTLGFEDGGQDLRCFDSSNCWTCHPCWCDCPLVWQQDSLGGKVWRIGSMVVLSAIWKCDRVIVLQWLLVNIGLQVWINTKSGGCRLVSVVLLGFWFCKGGLSTLMLFWLLILATSLKVMVQINPYSFELRLLSRILAEIWFWVIGPLFLGPGLLLAFSRVIAYQPVMNTSTSVSMENARNGYPKGMPDQLCYSLANLAQSFFHFRSYLNPLTSQFLLCRVRICSSSLLVVVLWMYFPSWDYNGYCNCWY